AGDIDNPTIVAVENMDAVGLPAGVKYGSNFRPMQYNDAGHIAFSNQLTGTGVNASNNIALFAGPASSPALLARTGDPALGVAAGVTYSQAALPSLNASGQYVFRMQLAGPGITADSNGAFYSGSIMDGPQLLLRGEDAAPG